MNNEKGMAVVIVLLFLGIVSLLGVGLMTQSRLDTKFSSKITTIDSMLSLADAGASNSLKDLPKTPPQTGLDPTISGYSIFKTLPDRGIYTYRAIYIGTAPQNEIAGFEISLGGYGSGSYYASYWLAEGRGQSTNLVEPVSNAIGVGSVQTTIELATVQVAPN